MESIELIGIVISMLVILIEVLILFSLYRHSKLMVRLLKTQDEHTNRMQDHIKELDESMENVLKNVESVYKRVCQPDEDA
ncbi:MAG: hypothetical protein ABH851_08830 [Methanobacteriota archaeon]